MSLISLLLKMFNILHPSSGCARSPCPFLKSPATQQPSLNVGSICWERDPRFCDVSRVGGTLARRDTSARNRRHLNRNLCCWILPNILHAPPLDERLAFVILNNLRPFRQFTHTHTHAHRQKPTTFKSFNGDDFDFSLFSFLGCFRLNLASPTLLLPLHPFSKCFLRARISIYTQIIFLARQLALCPWICARLADICPAPCSTPRRT